MKFPVFDLHCDTALELVTHNSDEPIQLRSNQLHIDLERAKAFPAYCQCFACFTTPAMTKWGIGSPVTVFEKELETICSQVAVNGDLIAQAYSPEDVVKNAADGKMSAILTIEGPAGFDFDPDLLPMLHKVGFRITTLGWNEDNILTGSHKTGGGLTDKGRAYVREAQRLGMLVDVSHISDQAFWDIMEITQGPVIASHSNSRSVYPVSRNLTDEMFLAICKTGGVVGLNLYADFIGEGATLDMACEHILHWLSLDPDGKHIALGGDLDGCDTLVEGFTGVQDYEKLADCLLAHGISEEMVHNIFWNNALEVMGRAVCNN